MQHTYRKYSSSFQAFAIYLALVAFAVLCYIGLL